MLTLSYFNRERWCAIALVTSFFVVGALLPGCARDYLKNLLGGADVENLAHFFFPFFISILCFFSFSHFWLVFFFVLTLGGGVEVVQIFIPGRTASIADFGVDVLGVLSGSIFYFLINYLKYRSDKSRVL